RICKCSFSKKGKLRLMASNKPITTVIRSHIAELEINNFWIEYLLQILLVFRTLVIKRSTEKTIKIPPEIIIQPVLRFQKVVVSNATPAVSVYQLKLAHLSLYRSCSQMTGKS